MRKANAKVTARLRGFLRLKRDNFNASLGIALHCLLIASCAQISLFPKDFELLQDKDLDTSFFVLSKSILSM